MEDYTKYLSIDNGHGILLSKGDVSVLDRYHVEYSTCSSLKELILLIQNILEFEDDDEELEEVINHLSEVYYYQEVNK